MSCANILYRSLSYFGTGGSWWLAQGFHHLIHSRPPAQPLRLYLHKCRRSVRFPSIQHPSAGGDPGPGRCFKKGLKTLRNHWNEASRSKLAFGFAKSLKRPAALSSSARNSSSCTQEKLVLELLKGWRNKLFKNAKKMLQANIHDDPYPLMFFLMCFLLPAGCSLRMEHFSKKRLAKGTTLGSAWSLSLSHKTNIHLRITRRNCAFNSWKQHMVSAGKHMKDHLRQLRDWTFDPFVCEALGCETCWIFDYDYTTVKPKHNHP